jgi:pilus assembly protein CpaE
MMQFSDQSKSFGVSGHSPESLQRVAFVDDAISPAEIAALAAQFPNARFESVGADWPQKVGPAIDVLIVGLSAASHSEIERGINFLKARSSRLNVLVALRHADVAGSRTLTRAGAADVVPVPGSEAAWALSIERMLIRAAADRDPSKKTGQVVALLKAGGGVGATSLGVQAALSLAARSGGHSSICFADLDLQFGSAALYLDLDQALTVGDCVAVGEVLEETQFVTALAAHQSGVRLLSAPRDVMALDILTPKLVDGLVAGLRRDFALTIVDMPSVWTAWTNRALQLADRIVLVTGLSVAHVHLVRRQLQVLALQNLDRLPLTLVCNAVTAEQQNLLGVKAAERAIGRPFDIVLPEEVRAMKAATNQGLPLSGVARNSKLEKYVGQLADRIAADALAAPPMRR